MGCTPSKATERERKARLEDLESLEQKLDPSQPASYRTDAELLKAVDELVLLSKFYYGVLDGKDSQANGRVQKLSKQIADNLVELLDIQMFRRNDHIRVQNIVKAAYDLDEKVSGSNAVRSVEGKRHQLHGQILKDCVAAVDKCVDDISSSGNLLAKSKELFAHVQKAERYAAGQDAEVVSLLKSCKRYSKVALEYAGTLVLKDEDSFKTLKSIAEKLDSTCSKLGQSWENMKPGLEDAHRKAQAARLPEAMDEAEAAIADVAAINYQELLRCCKVVVSLWGGKDAELEKRLKGVMEIVDAQALVAFDQVLGNGKTDTIQQLLSFATEYEGLCADLFGKRQDAESLAFKLNQKYAGVTLQSLLSRFDSYNKERCDVLHAAYEKAAQEVKAMSKQQLRKRDGAQWFFKTRQLLKEYSADKSMEVERHYQKWVAAGRPKGAEHRCEIILEIAKPRGSVQKKSSRAPCRYGDKCYQKNPEHRRRYCHPGDADYPAPGDEDLDGSQGMTASTSVTQENFSLDFHIMTQMNSTRNVMRTIVRKEGQTFLSKTIQPYLDLVTDFAKDIESTATNAERKLRMLAQEQRTQAQRDLDTLFQAAGPPIKEFLQLAMYVQGQAADMKLIDIDEVLVLLGTSAEALKIDDMLKDLRLSDVTEELKTAFLEQAKELKRKGTRWDNVRFLHREGLLRGRIGMATRREQRSILIRRRAHARCQALLSSYDTDVDFHDKFRQQASEIFSAAVQDAVCNNDSRMMMDALRLASSLDCDTLNLVDPVRTLLRGCIRGACKSPYQSMANVVAALGLLNEASTILDKPPEEVLDLSSPSLLDLLATRAMWETSLESPFPKFKPSPLSSTVEFRSKLGTVTDKFDTKFWTSYQVSYDATVAALVSGDSEEAEKRKGAMIEWALAICEQTRQPVPKWMMTKEQNEALHRLRKAIQQQDETVLREAVIYAKQANYQADTQLLQAYEESVAQLKKMKRLPSGWDVEDLVGDKIADAGIKMFAQKVVSDSNLKALFQKLLDQTTEAKLTRDRAARGGDAYVPTGYRVERVETVMNAESWSNYLKRRDAITQKCKTVPGSAPCSDDVWRSWGGIVASRNAGRPILDHCHAPALDETANEYLMFHGTKADAASAIAKHHFDISRAFKMGMFGGGLYFAESCSKADEYVTATTVDGKQQFPMVLSRVSLGRIFYCDSQDPTKDPGRQRLESHCVGGEYHSVLGDRKKVRGTYREFIVYDHWQVYPAFVIWYTRL